MAFPIWISFFTTLGLTIVGIINPFIFLGMALVVGTIATKLIVSTVSTYKKGSNQINKEMLEKEKGLIKELEDLSQAIKDNNPSLQKYPNATTSGLALSSDKIEILNNTSSKLDRDLDKKPFQSPKKPK